MKLLVVGDFAHRIYEPELCDALREIGVEVIEVPVLHYFGPGSLLQRAQTRLVAGPGVALANAALVAACRAHRPDAVFAWRTPWLGPLGIRAARLAGARRVVLYNNDDPFGPDRGRRLWRAFRKSIPAADLCLAYRDVNVPEYVAAGARAVALWRSAFVPRVHRPVELTAAERASLGSDVVFAGHWEDDGRAALLEALARNGLRVRVFGTGWEGHLGTGALASIPPVRAVRGDDYAKALCASKVALVFLSARNRDEYTRRCFEIPACGVAMLAPRTRVLESLFVEGAEALYFDGADELAQNARRLVEDQALRARIAAGGLARVWRDGHDLPSRARELLGLVGGRPA